MPNGLTVGVLQAMETDDAKGDDKPKKTRKVKKQVKKGELPVVSVTAAMDASVKEIWIERENQMFMEDKLVADTEDRKNALEEYIYENRSKIDDLYADFASDEEKAKVKKVLDDAEVRSRCSRITYGRAMILTDHVGMAL
jgi:heat shock protein 4